MRVATVGIVAASTIADLPHQEMIAKNTPLLRMSPARKSPKGAALPTGSNRRRHKRAQSLRSLARWRPEQQARSPLNCRLKNSLTGTGRRPMRCQSFVYAGVLLGPTSLLAACCDLVRRRSVASRDARCHRVVDLASGATGSQSRPRPGRRRSNGFPRQTIADVCHVS
jgi:hypothetical protein